MKLKKSIPMYTTLMLILVLSITISMLNIIDLTSISSTNSSIILAIRQAIIFNDIIIIGLFYYFHITIINFNAYLNKLKQIKKTSNLFDKLTNTIENKIQTLVNDKSIKLKKEHFENHTEDDMFEKKKREGDLSLLDNIGFNEFDSMCFNKLDKPVTEIKHIDVVGQIKIFDYITKLMKDTKRFETPDWFYELPQGMKEAIDITNNSKASNVNIKLPLVVALSILDNGKFINNKGIIEYKKGMLEECKAVL